MLPLARPLGDRNRTFAVLAVIGMAASILGALAFQHIGGYIPCALCYMQRTPYYTGLPVMLAGLVLQARGVNPIAVRGLYAIGAVLMLYGMALAIYHSGVEWHFWAGPADCTSSGSAPDVAATDLLATIDKVKPPMCDEAALRILGLSMAGWNAIASAVWTWLAAKAAFARG